MRASHSIALAESAVVKSAIKVLSSSEGSDLKSKILPVVNPDAIAYMQAGLFPTQLMVRRFSSLLKLPLLAKLTPRKVILPFMYKVIRRRLIFLTWSTLILSVISQVIGLKAVISLMLSLWY